MNNVKLLLIQSLLDDYLSKKCLSEDDYDNRARIACQILRDNFQKIFEKLTESRDIDDEVTDQIKDFWECPLDLLELQVQFSKEAANITGNLYAIDSDFQSIRLIHGRGCHIAAEILYLLKGGFSDGAEARWRTLYELDVISEFIRSTGKNIGERYIAYEAVEMYKYYNSIIKYYQNMEEKLTPEERIVYENTNRGFELTKRDVETYCKLYGESFKNDYGWAVDALGKKKPNFTDIQEKAGYYGSHILRKAAHFPIHVGPRAALYRRGLPESGFMLMGPSTYGLKDIINNTAIALDSLNRSLVLKCSHYKIVAIYDFQSVLIEKIMKTSLSAEKILGHFQP
jgi:hypothetical protein